MELVSCRYKTVIEVVARNTICHLVIEHLLQCVGFGSRCGSSKNDALTFLDMHLEVARNIKVFIGSIATFLFFRILHTTIPVGLEDKLILFVKLHVEIRVACIHTCLDAVVHGMVFTRCR